MLLAVVIPVYNERGTLPALVERVLAAEAPAIPGSGARCDRRLILVDDGSTDGSDAVVRELGQRAGFIAVTHERNRGKGSAISSGFARAVEIGADLVIIQDADLEYDPAEHEAVLRPILDGRADVVIGSRFLGQTHRVLYYWHSVANKAITTFSNMCTNLNLTDVECCFKAFRRDVVSQLTIEEPRFGVEPELVAKVSRMRLPAEPGRTRAVRIYEVPVSYAGRTYSEGKKITWRDGLSALRCIVKYNLLR
ncbi:MAG TPA: glycosyltransferase family 2 protein [Phycisphaerales bacterium]|nr:glycosyltransferase family 2 protein [Phycisphaerales bacterium]